MRKEIVKTTKNQYKINKLKGKRNSETSVGIVFTDMMKKKKKCKDTHRTMFTKKNSHWMET